MYGSLLNLVKHLAPQYPLYLLLLVSAIVFGGNSSILRGSQSLILLSSEGYQLRHFREKKYGSFTRWMKLEEYPSGLITALLTAEDKRFLYHTGFDPISTLRASYQNLTHGRIVSGGSTITQQVVRLLYRNRLPSNIYHRKVLEMILSVGLELRFSKREILESYLNLSPFKYNQVGFANAAALLFKRDVRYLTREEVVALAVLLRQPNAGKRIFLKRFYHLWGELHYQGNPEISLIVKSVYTKPQAVSHSRGRETMHYEQWFYSRFPRITGTVQTAMKSSLNGHIDRIIQSEMLFLKEYGVTNSAVVVIKLPDENHSNVSLVSMVGSIDFYNSKDGQINGAVTKRTAGSTLKPLLYGLAMDKLHLRSYDIIYDRDMSFATGDGATYRPENYDQKYWGAITVRRALVASRNIPAVYLVDKVGVNNFYSFLLKAGFTSMEKHPKKLGHGIALGTGGATLLNLVHAYSSFATGGVKYPLYIGKDEKRNGIYLGEKKVLFSKETAAVITHILSRREERWHSATGRSFLDFPYDVAVKTGTSKDYRDAWVVGYTNSYAVGVWVGNFSGNIMKRVSGAWGAGRIFQQVIRHLVGHEKPVFRYPGNLDKVPFCAKTGKRAGPGCPHYIELYNPADKDPGYCAIDHKSRKNIDFNFHGQGGIVSPVNGEKFVLDYTRNPEEQLIPLTFDITHKGVYSYSVNSSKRKPISGNSRVMVIPKRGEYVIRLFRNDTEIDAVRFTVR